MNPSDGELIQMAQDEYASNEIEIDDDAKTSRGEDQTGEIGAWVAAWVWVEYPTA